MILPLVTAPAGQCLVFNNNTANGVDCGQILGWIISKAVTPTLYWAYGATAAIIILGIALPIVVWRMGSLGRRLWGWHGDLALMLFGNGTGEIYKVTQAFANYLKIVSKRTSGLLASGRDTSFPSSSGHTLHVIDVPSMNAASMGVVEYTTGLDDHPKWKDAKNMPEVIPTSLDGAAAQYCKYRVMGNGDDKESTARLERLKASYVDRYGEEVPAEIISLISSKGNPVQELAKLGGSAMRRFNETMIDMAANDTEPLWPIAGVSVDARVIFRWASSIVHPIDIDVAYQTGYDDGKADSKNDDKRLAYAVIIVAIFVGGAILASVLK